MLSSTPCDGSRATRQQPHQRHGTPGVRVHGEHFVGQRSESSGAGCRPQRSEGRSFSLTRSLSLELAAYGVRVNAVCPGPVYTGLQQESDGTALRLAWDHRRGNSGADSQGCPPRPMGTAQGDIIWGVAYLCNPRSTWVTGEVLGVSGDLEGVAAAPPKRGA